ncbi:YegP family protein [Acidovorax lacteus]|uniref:YegP family protein n=1 Tax=Acidovorax lacteus TaxID=1924988 RepID=A0ABP8KXH2_9BURK
MAACFEIARESDGRYRISLQGEQGDCLLRSEPLPTRAAALGALDALRQHGALDARYGRLSARDGSPYFTLKAGNGQVLAQSPRFRGARARDEGIAQAQRLVAQAPVRDLNPEP